MPNAAAQRSSAAFWVTAAPSGHVRTTEVPATVLPSRPVSKGLADAGLAPADVGHVNACGIATVAGDQAEAQAIHEVLGDVPVTAPKSFFGDIGAASGAVEAVASLLGFARGEIPVTLNYEKPDSQCPVNVVHGSSQPIGKPVAMLLNQAEMGQAVALVIASEPSALA